MVRDICCDIVQRVFAALRAAGVKVRKLTAGDGLPVSCKAVGWGCWQMLDGDALEVGEGEGAGD